jgi:hypothetical protein
MAEITFGKKLENTKNMRKITGAHFQVQEPTSDVIDDQNRKNRGAF